MSQGGTWNIPKLALVEQAVTENTSNFMLQVVVFGVCLIITLYHLVIYFQRPEDITPLVFAFSAGRPHCDSG